MPVYTNSLSGLNKLSSHSKLKVREIYCPVSKVTVHTSPLTVGDDLSLRTMISSPEFYDREIASLIYKHSTFPEYSTRPTFDEFVNMFSSFDRRLMLYGIYSSTYKILAKDTIKCSNCGHEFEDSIKSEEIINAESFKIWDKEKPFTEYFKEIKIDIDPDQENTINDIIFITRIPSIKDNFNVLSLTSPDQIQYTFEKTGQILTRSQELSLVTKSIQVNSNVSGNSEVDYINDLDSIYQAISEYITSDIVGKVITEYNAEFDDYSPNFAKKYTCSNCTFEFEYGVNLESHLFRNFFGL
jgi:DNA-directed RNA polymerase subunit RPC12/RpoP